jgi:hypothetical protein
MTPTILAQGLATGYGFDRHAPCIYTGWALENHLVACGPGHPWLRYCRNSDPGTPSVAVVASCLAWFEPGQPPRADPGWGFMICAFSSRGGDLGQDIVFPGKTPEHHFRAAPNPKAFRAEAQ